ncbi:MAG: DUF3108 domain-containing protein [bacterium]
MLSIFLLLITVGAERLEYEIKYGPMVLGAMVMERLPSDSCAEGEYEHFRADIEIDRALAFVFWARYRLESWCRRTDKVTVRSYKMTREKNFRDEWQADYAPEAGFVRYSDGVRLPLSNSARDMLSLWFYLRTLKLAVGDSQVVNAHIDKRNWRVCFVVNGTQRVKTSAGDFDCFVITPRTTSPLGAVYISQDWRRVPVVIRTRISRFTVSAYLKRIGGR